MFLKRKVGMKVDGYLFLFLGMLYLSLHSVTSLTKRLMSLDFSGDPLH